MENKTGITLIALVVTIVVLVILAAVSINVLIGENGIINQAKQFCTYIGHYPSNDYIFSQLGDYKFENRIKPSAYNALLRKLSAKF